MRNARTLRLAEVAVVLGCMVSAKAGAVVLCQKATGAVFARTTCKKKETAVDVASLVASSAAVTQLQTGVAGVTTQESTLSGQVSTLSGQVSTLNSAGFLTKTSTGAVAGYATVDSAGNLQEGFSKTGAAVTSVRNMIGDYSVDFGFTIQPNQPILLSTRENFSADICKVFQGSSPASTASVFCGFQNGGTTTAVDVAFTIVVLN